MLLPDVTESHLTGHPHCYLTIECVPLQHFLAYINQPKAMVASDCHRMVIITYIR
jgi:hypothetical protein